MIGIWVPTTRAGRRDVTWPAYLVTALVTILMTVRPGRAETMVTVSVWVNVIGAGLTVTVTWGRVFVAVLRMTRRS